MLTKAISTLFISCLALCAHAQQMLIPAPPQVAASGYILMDAQTGTVLIENNADERLPPASLSKIMTVYIVASELEEGRIQLDDKVRVSPNAWRKGGAASGGSTMFLDPNSEATIEELLHGVIIQSGNDASIALAEHLAGSEDAFADIMNQTAQLLGMTNSTFENATGLPGENHLSTARDMAILARSMINNYPEIYSLYSKKSYLYNGITQPNRNTLLFRDPSVDGMKTGHTEEAGYCLVASAQRDDMRLVSVVMGTNSNNARAVETQKLLAYGFRYYENQTIYSTNDTVETERVWYGLSDQVELGVPEDIVLTLPRGTREQLDARMQLNDTIKAPISLGDPLGTLTISLEGEVLAEVPLVARHPVEEAGLFARLFDAIKLFLSNLFS